MHRKIVLILGVLCFIFGIASCDGCKEETNVDNEKPMNLVIGVHGVNADHSSFNLIFPGIWDNLIKQGKTKQEIVNGLGFISTGERIDNTIRMSIEDQVKALISEIKNGFERMPDQFACRPFNITLLGHSQGGPVSEEAIKLLLKDKSWMGEHNIIGFKLCTLGSPMFGLDGSCDDMKILNVRLKEILKLKIASGSLFEYFSAKEIDEFCDKCFSNTVLPSGANSGPGLKDLSLVKRKESSPPDCPVLYIGTKCEGFKALTEDWLLPIIMSRSLKDVPKQKGDSKSSEEYRTRRPDHKTLLKELKNMFSDAEKLEINNLWIKVLDNEENDGQVPLKSQYRNGVNSQTLLLDDVTHGGLLCDPRVIKKVTEFIFDNKK